jgi:ribosomal protein S18 acetylase RimI-like enzyme
MERTAIIRRADAADAPTLSALGALTFTESFGHLYSQSDLQAFIAESHSVAAYEQLLADPDYALWLAEEQGAAIGYALAGPSGLPHADVQPGDGELKRLYLLSSAQGGGIGARMFERALEWLEREGPRAVWISVWSENYGAQRLYARYGFQKVGEYDFIVGEQRDHEFIFHRKAGAA